MRRHVQDTTTTYIQRPLGKDTHNASVFQPRLWKWNLLQQFWLLTEPYVVIQYWCINQMGMTSNAFTHECNSITTVKYIHLTKSIFQSTSPGWFWTQLKLFSCHWHWWNRYNKVSKTLHCANTFRHTPLLGICK